MPDAPEALAQAHPETMAPLGEDERDPVLASPACGVGPRWDGVLRPTPPPGPAPRGHTLAPAHEAAAQALPQLCRPAFAGPPMPRRP